MFFNPLAQHRTEVVYIVVDNINVQVTDAEDIPIPCQINPVLNRFSVVVDDQFQVWSLVFMCSDHSVKILLDYLNCFSIITCMFSLPFFQVVKSSTSLLSLG